MAINTTNENKYLITKGEYADHHGTDIYHSIKFTPKQFHDLVMTSFEALNKNKNVTVDEIVAYMCKEYGFYTKDLVTVTHLGDYSVTESTIETE